MVALCRRQICPNCLLPSALRPGGFGILMVKSMADELLYNEAQNEVVFVKYLDNGNGSTSGRP